MIKTPYKCTYPVEVGINETEVMLQETYPGLRLIFEYKNPFTHQHVYSVCFENEKDYTWFTMKYL